MHEANRAVLQRSKKRRYSTCRKAALPSCWRSLVKELFTLLSQGVEPPHVGLETRGQSEVYKQANGGPPTWATTVLAPHVEPRGIMYTRGPISLSTVTLIFSLTHDLFLLTHFDPQSCEHSNFRKQIEIKKTFVTNLHIHGIMKGTAHRECKE